MDKAEIDALTAEFLGAFDNREGRTVELSRIRGLFVPGALVVMTGPKYTVYTVDGFIEPRQQLLSDGTLTDFSEWETSERTEIAGDVAARFGDYRKSGRLRGEPFEGGGTHSIQLVRTPDGWRIASFAWYDQP